MAMTDNVTTFPRKREDMECSKCGACAVRPCDCHAKFVAAGTLAKRALEKAEQQTTRKSNREIARDTGLSEPTVRRARTGAASNDAAPPRKPAPRTASVEFNKAVAAITAHPEMKDRAIARAENIGHKVVGKARRSINDGTTDTRNPQRGNTPNAAFLLRADEALTWAVCPKKVDERSLNAARATASAWCRLVETMEGKLK